MFKKVYDKEKQEVTLWWWEPDQESTLCQYLASSSLGGLRFISEPKRHILERIFWFISFTICFTGAVVMIKELWGKYYKNPVIVTFSTRERDISTIPFPAVTICNTSPFEKSKVEKFVKQYKESKSKEESDEALDALRAFNSVCRAQKSFLKTINFAEERGEIIGIPGTNESPSMEIEKNMTQFIMTNSQRCRHLIRRCIWKQQIMPCNELFMPIITNYGMCCTFNYMPHRLMGHYWSPTSDTYTQISKRGWWSDDDVREWDRWDYNNRGYIIRKQLKFPLRQQKAGFGEGLSVLLDPDPAESFCPTLDSLGVKILLHVPVENPRVANFGQVIETGKEVFMEVKPELTIASRKLRPISAIRRKCYFGEDIKLKYYRPYTRDNCIEECFNDFLFKKCGCVLYFMPRNSSTNVCQTLKDSTENKCFQRTKQEYNENADVECARCKFPCNDLSYTSQVSHARLQPKTTLWPEALKNHSERDWMKHDISIVHIFFNQDSTIPKLRQKLFQTVDLVANTGGLLGLLIGFSVLGMVEIIYFATIRICCRRLRKSQRFGSSPQIKSNIQSKGMPENKIFLRRVNNETLFNSILYNTKY